LDESGLLELKSEEKTRLDSDTFQGYPPSALTGKGMDEWYGFAREMARSGVAAA
jgi:hypothetical protein